MVISENAEKAAGDVLTCLVPLPVCACCRLFLIPYHVTAAERRQERGLHVDYASFMPYGLKAMRPTIMLTMPTRPTVARCLVISVLPSSSSTVEFTKK